MNLQQSTVVDIQAAKILCSFSFTSAATTMLTTGNQFHDSASIPITLTTIPGLIIFRIWSMRNPDTLCSSASGKLDNVIRILLESGSLPTVAIVVTLVAYLHAHPSTLVFVYTSIPIIVGFISYLRLLTHFRISCSAYHSIWSSSAFTIRENHFLQVAPMGVMRYLALHVIRRLRMAKQVLGPVIWPGALVQARLGGLRV